MLSFIFVFKITTFKSCEQNKQNSTEGGVRLKSNNCFAFSFVSIKCNRVSGGCSCSVSCLQVLYDIAPRPLRVARVLRRRSTHAASDKTVLLTSPLPSRYIASVTPNITAPVYPFNYLFFSRVALRFRHIFSRRNYGDVL